MSSAGYYYQRKASSEWYLIWLAINIVIFVVGVFVELIDSMQGMYYDTVNQ